MSQPLLPLRRPAVLHCRKPGACRAGIPHYLADQISATELVLNELRVLTAEDVGTCKTSPSLSRVWDLKQNDCVYSVIKKKTGSPEE